MERCPTVPLKKAIKEGRSETRIVARERKKKGLTDVKERGVGVEELEEKGLDNQGVFVLSLGLVVLPVVEFGSNEFEKLVQDHDDKQIDQGGCDLGNVIFVTPSATNSVLAAKLSSRKCGENARNLVLVRIASLRRGRGEGSVGVKTIIIFNNKKRKDEKPGAQVEALVFQAQRLKSFPANEV